MMAGVHKTDYGTQERREVKGVTVTKMTIIKIIK